MDARCSVAGAGLVTSGEQHLMLRRERIKVYMYMYEYSAVIKIDQQITMYYVCNIIYVHTCTWRVVRETNL